MDNFAVEVSKVHREHMLMADRLTVSFVMAINGAFFTLRGANSKPTHAEIETAKFYISSAQYTFIDGINDLFEKIKALNENKEDHSVIEKFHNHILKVSTELVVQGYRAVTLGNLNIANLFNNNIHGAQGQLLQSRIRNLRLTATDWNGQKWNSPQEVVKSVVALALISTEEER